MRLRPTQDQPGHQDVEDCGQRPADVVEGHPDVLEAQVVERDHGDEDDGEGQHLGHGPAVERGCLEVAQAGNEPPDHRQRQADEHGHHALEPRDEEGGVGAAALGAAQQGLVDEDQRDGDDPGPQRGVVISRLLLQIDFFFFLCTNQ